LVSLRDVCSSTAPVTAGSFLLLGGSLLTLSGCGGFQAARYPDPTELVFIRNPVPPPPVAVAPAPRRNVQPLPLPSLPRNTIESRPLPRESGAKPEVAVEPFNVPPRPLIRPLAADGVLELSNVV
jgi:hypothetical protein